MLTLEDVALAGFAEFGSIMPNSHLLKEGFPGRLASHGKIRDLQQTLRFPQRGQILPLWDWLSPRKRKKGQRLQYLYGCPSPLGKPPIVFTLAED
jgi:hypothetical protein